MNEEDPRQAADLMRKLSDMTGLELGAGMNEALRRMEKGEDPDQIEAEMGNILEEEDLLRLPDKKGKRIKTERILPNRMRHFMIFNFDGFFPSVILHGTRRT
jgi:hypothetical protein